MGVATTRDRYAHRLKCGRTQWIRQKWERFAQRFHFRTAQRAEHLSPSIGIVLIVQVSGWSGEAFVPLLRSADYAVQVVNDSTALEKVQRESPLVIIVGGAADLNLYRVLRGASTALILALVSDSDRERILEAFDAGVDDYQVVPISSAEIVARVHSMLRSVQRQSPSKFLA